MSPPTTRNSASPFARVWFVILAPLLFVRSLNITHYYFSEDAAAGPMNMIPVSLAYHTSVLLIVIAVVLFSTRSFRNPWVRAALLVFSASLMALGSVDFLVQHHLGSRLSPALVRLYGPGSLFNPEIFLNLFHDKVFTTLNLGATLLGWGLLFFLGSKFKWRLATITGKETGGLLTAAGLLILPVSFDRNLQKTITQPPELVWIQSMAPEKAWANSSATRKAFKNLSGTISVPYPHRPTQPGKPRPDIFILAIESLRAQNLEFITGPANSAHTPALSSLARAGVVFSRFIANGFPSTEGFLAIHCSMWPHPTRRILVQNTELRPDCLPSRLRNLGYYSKIFWGVNPDFDNQLSWARRWYDDLHYQVPGNDLKHHLNFSDAELFNIVTRQIGEFDRSNSGKSLFAYIANAGTHVPFTIQGQFFKNHLQEEEARRLDIDQTPDPNERYNRALELLDKQIGKFQAFLQTRKRPFVLVVLGDHSIPTRPPASSKLKRSPSNDYLWTGALIVGPQDLTGPPRTEGFPASQVDILPTVLALAGGALPDTGLGTDLLAPLPPQKRKAVAIREGRLRLDRGDQSLFADWNDDGVFEVHPFLGDNSASRSPSRVQAATRRDAEELVQAAQHWAWLLNQGATTSATH